MTLTRDNVTEASRIMLPTYVVFFGWLGLSYMFGPAAPLAASPALAFAAAVMPIEAWGGMFATCSALMAVALVVHKRILFRFALRVCAFSMLVWAAIILSATIAGDATLAASFWPAFVATACLASDRSLAAGEV
jgi:hypothetical protein